LAASSNERNARASSTKVIAAMTATISGKRP
jgi:hypothetical protein